MCGRQEKARSFISEELEAAQAEAADAEAEVQDLRVVRSQSYPESGLNPHEPLLNLTPVKTLLKRLIELYCRSWST